jgi:putative oxidoreductase
MSLVARVEKLLDSEGFTNLALLVARVLMSVPFIVFGPMKYINFEKMSGYVERAGLPGDLLWLIIPYQTLSALALILGFKTRWAAVLLGSFCIVATLIYHREWDRSGELAQFTKDLAMAGGFVLLWRLGPGAFSLEALLRRRTSRRMAIEPAS